MMTAKFVTQGMAVIFANMGDAAVDLASGRLRVMVVSGNPAGV